MPNGSSLESLGRLDWEGGSDSDGAGRDLGVWVGLGDMMGLGDGWRCFSCLVGDLRGGMGGDGAMSGRFEWSTQRMDKVGVGASFGGSDESGYRRGRWGSRHLESWRMRDDMGSIDEVVSDRI